MAKTIEFTAKNVKAFSGWLKRFSSIEHSLLMEVDEAKKCFTAKSYNDQKSVVKYSTISFEDSGFTLMSKSTEPRFIKVGIYNIPRVIKSLDHFQTGEFSFAVQYGEVLSGEEKDLAGTAILLKSSALKMKIECTSLQVFKYIPDEKFTGVIAASDPVAEFDLPNVTIEQINSLSDLDKEYKFLEFLNRDKKVFVRGKTFELDIADVGEVAQTLISVYKNQFDKVDVESYSVAFAEEKLVFRSKDSDTIVVTSMVVKDEKYEEESMEF